MQSASEPALVFALAFALAEAGHHPLHSPHVSAGHLLHQLFYLFKLLKQAVDVVYAIAGAPGNALLARHIANIRLSALQRGHRFDYRFRPVDCPLVELDILHRGGIHSGSIPMICSIEPMFFICTNCSMKSSRVNSDSAYLFLKLGGFLRRIAVRLFL